MKNRLFLFKFYQISLSTVYIYIFILLNHCYTQVQRYIQTEINKEAKKEKKKTNINIYTNTCQKETRGSVGCVAHISFCFEKTLYRTFHRCFLPNFGSFGYSVSEENIFLEITRKKELPMVTMFVNRSRRNEQSSQKTFHRCFIPCFVSFGLVVSAEKIFQISTNQKQELPVAAMFVNESGRYEQFVQRTFHRCFILSFGSFGQAVSEEKNLFKLTNQKQELPVAPCL